MRVYSLSLVVFLVGCGNGSDCDAGYGLAADGKCYPIYDPNNPPFGVRVDTGSSTASLDDGGGSAGADGGDGADAGGSAGAGSGSADDGGGTGSPDLPTVFGTVRISVDAPVTTGDSLYVAAWQYAEVMGELPSEAAEVEATYSIPAPGSELEFALVFERGVPPDGASIWVAAVLDQGDGDRSDDPFTEWADNPGTLTPVDPITGVELFFE